MSDSLLKVTNLRKSFYHRPILREISFTIREGEIVGLLGKNGVGKSTLLRIIAGLSSSDGGNIRVLGNSVESGNIKGRKDTLYLGHAVGLYPPLSAVENLALALTLYGLPVSEKQIRSTLREVGLITQQDDAIKVYSQGMLQRLKLSLAFLIPWSLLLFDEPFSGLDIQGRHLAETVIKKWKQERKTLLLVIHDLEWALNFCTRIVLLAKGDIVFDGKVEAGENLPIRNKYAEIMT
ncbi:MAG: ABC transporter ATP-binding protein [FCB group bacterium]|nr:ABC transporter ATP-binding protein [FCB group bacterium]